MNKKEFRLRMLRLRKNILDKTEKSKIICEKIASLPEYQNSKVIAAYSALDDEVDLTNIINECLVSGKTICLPKVSNESSMVFYKIDSLKDLKKGCFNILEPTSDKEKEIECSNIELFLIPGVAFDKNYNRLGYGKGYYDNFLINSKGAKIGVAFKEQVMDSFENLVNENDIKMDKIIHN